MTSYKNQSESLKHVQKYGPALELSIKNALGWDRGRLTYYKFGDIEYNIQVDSVWPNVESPQAFVSVTYTNPATPGHSNENKLQLKLGELMLFKGLYPEIRGVLVLGGTKEAWAPYVLEAFNYFFDKTIYAWEEGFEQAIEDIKEDPSTIPLRHSDTWEKLSKEWYSTELSSDLPVESHLRFKIWEYVKENGFQGDLPKYISNEVFQHCMNASYNLSVATRSRSGKEWTHYYNEDWYSLWQSRSFFNPAEAAIELLLIKEGFSFKGGLAKDVDVPSLIHHLGGKNVDKTKVSEDFILYSKKLDKPVFIQSKSSGGGLGGHGKNIQNRTKEQLARSLFYRGGVNEDQITLRPKDYYWIGVLDGNWAVTKKTPLKYIHMLKWAGYDFLIGAETLVDENLDLNNNSLLINKIKELDCIKDNDEFEALWEKWISERKKQ